ncbi:hypothetical protein A2J03_22240 [Rhodococcus sp. EPR-157]|nr:hypothetical protein A2J03_22240 [Rhodococcus sp. EPR-157]
MAFGPLSASGRPHRQRSRGTGQQSVFAAAAGDTAFMADDRSFVSDSDHGQAGWVTLPSGQRAYRYEDSDDLICDTGTAPDAAASN